MKVEKDPIVKARVIIDGQLRTVKVHKSDLNSGAYQKAPKKPTKTKMTIIQSRKSDYYDPN